MQAFPRIKICGVTRVPDLEYLAESGVDTVGINLVASSKRFVADGQAIELAIHARRLGLRTAAVLMNPTAQRLAEVTSLEDWDFIQLHGSEEPEIVDLCRDIPIIKALSCSGLPGEFELAKRWLARWNLDPQAQSTAPLRRSKSTLACILIDAYAPVQGGGTGVKARWDLLWPRPMEIAGAPIVLAGGLTPSNVYAAIIQTCCDGVDTASGVESNPGRKSREFVAEFSRQARAGFDSLSLS